MSIAVVNTTEAPEQTTVGSFSIQRLGVYPSMTVTLVETVADRCIDTVTGMVLADPAVPGVFSGVTLSTASVEGIVGQPVTKPDATVVGTVDSVSVTLPGPTVATQVLFTTTTTEDLTGVTLTIQRKNTFGVDALRGARQGRMYDLMLTSTDSAQLSRMQQLMGSAHVKAVMVTLAQLGVSKTVAEVQAAVMAASDNLESILATEFEGLELERRGGTFVGRSVGNVPT